MPLHLETEIEQAQICRSLKIIINQIIEINNVTTYDLNGCKTCFVCSKKALSMRKFFDRIVREQNITK